MNYAIFKLRKKKKHIDCFVRILLHSQTMNDTNDSIIFLSGTVVAFSAHTVVDRSPATGQVYVFSNTVFNHGDGYHNATGVFTAPVSGVYVFTVQMCSVAARYVYYAFVKTGGSKIVKGWMGDIDDTLCHVASAITKLTKGEETWLQCSYGTSGVIYAGTGNVNMLSGSLLQEVHE